MRLKWLMGVPVVLLLSVFLLGTALGSSYYSAHKKKVEDLFLDPEIRWVPDPSRAEVWVLKSPDDFPGSAAERNGATPTILLFGSEPSWRKRIDAIHVGGGGPRIDSVTLVPTEKLDFGWADSVNWESLPVVRHVVPLVLPSEAEVLLEASETGDPIVARLTGEHFDLFLFGIDPTTDANRELRGWPYFSYLIDSFIAESREEEVPRYSSWAWAPVPGERFARWSLIVILLLGGGTLLTFWRARSHWRRLPLKTEFPSSSGKDWARPGFERPLAGFLFLISMTIILLIPTFYYTNVLFANRIVPSPQALGMDRWVFWFFTFFWLFFDLGTGESMVKFFSQHFSRDPRRAYRYVNFFVWWQIFTGLLQLGSVVAATFLLLKYSEYAYLSFLFIFHALRQYPGLFYVRDDQQPLASQSFFSIYFRAIQRFDLEQSLRFYSIFLMVGCQVGGILLARSWGRSHPQYGEILSMAAGLSLSAFVAYFLSFLVGAWIAARHGQQLRRLFAADFDLSTARESLGFGSRVIAGNLAFQFAELIQTLIIATLLLRYTELLGIWFFMLNFGALYHALRPYTDSLAPAVSEAISTGRKKLFEYSVASGLRYGSLYGLCIAALLATTSAPFVRTFTEPQWHLAAQFLPIFALWGYLIHPTHIAFSILIGAGRPGSYSLTVILEQVIRLGMMIVLIPRYQFWGIIFSYLIPIIIKNTVVWTLIWRSVIRFRIYWWPVLISPTLAALLLGLMTMGAGHLYWSFSAPWVQLAFCLNLLISFPLVFFCNGLLGGWDQAGLEELEKASRMAGMMRLPATGLVVAARLGARLSPLPLSSIPLQAEATAERPSLVPSP